MHFEEIFKTIKTRREAFAITQEGLSEISGISLRTIKQIERGKGNPTLKTLVTLADILGMELSLEIKKTS